MRVRLSVFGPLAVLAVGAAVWRGEFRLLPVALGLLLWTAIEYLMHRYAFHGFAPHWEHHEKPAEAKFIVAPLTLSLPVASAVWLLVSLAMDSAVQAGLLIAGVIAGYLAYEAVHLRIHSEAAGGPLLRALRRYHYYHHFADDSVCYGVTTPLWDMVFATRRSKESARAS